MYGMQDVASLIFSAKNHLTNCTWTSVLWKRTYKAILLLLIFTFKEKKVKNTQHSATDNYMKKMPLTCYRINFCFSSRQAVYIPIYKHARDYILKYSILEGLESPLFCLFKSVPKIHQRDHPRNTSEVTIWAVHRPAGYLDGYLFIISLFSRIHNILSHL